MRADITQAADLATRYGGNALFLVSLATLAWVPGCFIDRSGTTVRDGGGVDGSTIDTGTGCPAGLVDLDGLPGCECTIRPETCNGTDDDCDTRTDEDSDVACGMPGTCSEGLQECVGGVLGACVMTTLPPPEICGNMIDDDCDMAIDEGCMCEPLGSTQSCGDDTGQCVAGMQTCVPEGWGPCEGATGPEPETCNNLDDDCDGTIDGMTQPCSNDVGLCTAGIETCDRGRFRGCTGVGRETELCDALGDDEDCDGVSNEGCACDEGDMRACGCAGVETCDLMGIFGMCIDMPPPETCNAMDDDCDGDTDEGATCGMCVQQNRGTRSYLFCFDAAVRRNWDDARAYCMMFGYDLVTVEDSGEDDWLRQRERSLDRNDRDWWYGGSDAAMEGTWRWVPTMMDFGSHESWTGGGEPNGGEAENCLSSKDRGSPEWSSRDCSESLRFACEAQGS